MNLTYTLRKIRNNFFHGNFFAALCVVALSIETNFYHNIPLNGILYYSIIFVATVTFYSFLYIKGGSSKYSNDRMAWYAKYNKALKLKVKLLAIYFLVAAFTFCIIYWQNIVKLSAIHIGQIAIFPIIAATYAFNILPFPHLKKLRRIGWLKPFIIGFVWSGVVTVLPVIFYQIQTGKVLEKFAYPSGIFWLINFMYISTLCIMFDVKDVENDKISGIKTFSVSFGTTQTILYIILPLSVAGLLSFWLIAFKQNMQTLNIIFQTIPYIALILVAFSLIKKPRKLIYYLFVIDGLMIVKAVCGILALKIN
jgi:4-hydroxybenzoate polyprenyltransferase